jgi:tetratricopeptide (TPR) repeat protein
MDHQPVKRSLLSAFNAVAEMAARKANLNTLMEQDSPSYQRAAFLLIEEMLFALKIGEQEEHYLERKELIDEIINNEDTPEEYAHQLLRLKLAYHLQKQDYDFILRALSRIENPEDRLACSTYECYKLMLLKIQVLLAQQEYEQAYHYLQSMSDVHFDQDYFLELPHDERHDLMNEYLLKKALVAHFCKFPESYDLFQELSERPNNGFHLNLSNVNNFIVFGNECAERKKFDKAVRIFTHLCHFLSTIENKTESDLNAYNQAKKMLTSITSALDYSKSFAPLFEANVNPQAENSREIPINTLTLVGENRPSI